MKALGAVARLAATGGKPAGTETSVRRQQYQFAATGEPKDMTMKTKRTDVLHGFPKRALHRWTIVLGVGLMALSGTLFPTPAQAAAPVSLTLKGQWPPHARTTALNVAVQGQHAYVPTTTGFLILDVSNPGNPVPVGSSAEELPSEYRDAVAVSGSYVYLGNRGYVWEPERKISDGDFQVIDVSDPANPVRRGKLLNIGVLDVAVSGNHAYVAGSRPDGTNWISGLQVIDVSNPHDPRRVGGQDTEGEARGVAVLGNHACVLQQRRLEVLDISNPTDPQPVGTSDFEVYVTAMAVADNYAYLAAEGVDLMVIDINDPTDPKPVGQYSDADFYAWYVAVTDSRAYVIGHVPDDYGPELRVLDVSDPANPTHLGSSDDVGYFGPGSGGVTAAGSTLFVVANSWDWFSPEGPGVQIIDVSDPANAVRVGGYNPNPRVQDLVISGNYAYLADSEAGLHVIDISNPEKPERVAGYDLPAWWAQAGDVTVAVADHYTYLADLSNEVIEVIDVSNPAKPVRVGGYRSRGGGHGMAVAGNHAYVAETRWTGSDYRGGGLQVINMSNPANPVHVGSYYTSEALWDVAAGGNYAYVANGNAGLQVIDVSDPAKLMRVGGASGPAWRLAVAGDYAYVASSRQEGTNSVPVMQVFDVSDPANPVRVGGVDTSGPARDVAVQGQYAYVAQGWWDSQAKVSRGRLEVIDVSNPATPVRVGGFGTSGSPLGVEGVTVAGHLIYVADGTGGLLILEQSTAPPPPAEWVRVETDLASTPFGRAFHGMVYDSVRGVVLLHGGNPAPGSQSFTDTWAWDGTSWTRLTTQGPSVLGFGFAFDSDRGVAVLHGGLGNGSPRPFLAATWEWDGALWRQVSNGSGPGVRAAPAMAYDPNSKRVILHGGTLDLDMSRILSDTWAWDGTAWQEIPNANGPPRAKHQMVYDEQRQVLVLFGGAEARGSAPVNTWEFDGAQWRQVATAGPPGGRELPVLAYDSVRGVTVLWGGGEWQQDGFPAHKAFDDTWEWNGEAWTEVATEGLRPAAAQATAGAYDPRRGRLVQFGGTRGGGDLVPRQTWEYGLSPLRITGVTLQGNGLEIRWTGGAPFYQLQRRARLSEGGWEDIGAPTDQVTATVPADGAASFFRVLSLFGNTP
ncbi:MAG: hypothetical protein FJ387_08185 [Verrucomicrobia bacterium]|nr:hypothetical protein [Verrucomicrobiota bacterium]